VVGDGYRSASGHLTGCIALEAADLVIQKIAVYKPQHFLPEEAAGANLPDAPVQTHPLGRADETIMEETRGGVNQNFAFSPGQVFAT
jgi:hypothetical protein